MIVIVSRVKFIIEDRGGKRYITRVITADEFARERGIGGLREIELRGRRWR